MAGYIGMIEPFDDTLETWTSYTERLKQYFALNDIEGEKQVPALTLLGRKTYNLLRNPRETSVKVLQRAHRVTKQTTVAKAVNNCRKVYISPPSSTRRRKCKHIVRRVEKIITALSI
jgi:dihydrofolate reductase